MIDRTSAVRIVVQPYATALPLGCMAFGVGNAVLAAFTAGWLPASDAHAVGVLMLAFVAPLELLPCVMAFLARDTGSMTAMGIFTGGWVVLGLQILHSGPGVPSPVTGLFFLLLGLCLAILAACTFSGKPLIGGLFCVAIVRSCAGGLVQFGIGGFAVTAAIWFGLLLSGLAFYCALGLLLEDVLQRPLGMMLRSKKALTAMTADLDEQMKDVAREAGVRQQL